ncbi:radical SAM protein [Halomonas koreensis]|uniref:Oxygen-independent coproporphyrinogen III oxidase n=1 Tax=Halomonas koreensis TaxID=245385 RepID=A0ABU1G134_9GAMM|nr:radical SAM protein [Halomonas koreensis]MDR5866636.1 hypothetical protein [Halomonas koreensis]
MPVRAPRRFGADDFETALAASNAVGRPLSVRLALPFCRQACRHCARPVAGDATGIPEAYLTRLDREMVLVRRPLDPARRVQALHWGGGTPSLLRLDQMSDLIDRLAARFSLESGPSRDFAIELDPREADVLTLRHLEALGFNRLRLTVLDLTPRVQAAVGRPCPRPLIEPLLDEADRLGFRSLAVELALGLPHQSGERLADTLSQVAAMAPPRILLHRASPPVAGAPDADDLEARAERLLAEAGYAAWRPGHYARRGPALDDARAQADREARRDRLGLGVGAHSRLPDAEARNATTLADYAAALDAGRLATASGQWRSRPVDPPPHRADGGIT